MSVHLNKVINYLLIIAACVFYPGNFTIARTTPLTQPGYTGYLFETAPNQNGLGVISGKVYGDLVPQKGAELTLLQNDVVIATTTTDEDGNFKFTYLNPGYYDLKGVKTGYRTAITNTIPVHANEETNNDFYIPKYNNNNMNRYPIVETYHASKRR